MTCEMPSLEVECSSSMPLTVFTASSILFVISVSISCGDAPGIEVVMTTVGNSTFRKKIHRQPRVTDASTARSRADSRSAAPRNFTVPAKLSAGKAGTVKHTVCPSRMPPTAISGTFTTSRKFSVATSRATPVVLLMNSPTSVSRSTTVPAKGAAIWPGAAALARSRVITLTDALRSRTWTGRIWPL